MVFRDFMHDRFTVDGFCFRTIFSLEKGLEASRFVRSQSVSPGYLDRREKAEWRPWCKHEYSSLVNGTRVVSGEETNAC